MARLQIRRGLRTNLPNSGMLPGEQLFTTDRGTMHVATSPTSKVPLVPEIDALANMPAIAPAEDLLILHDASENGAGVQKEKRVTVAAFKEALNIPESSTDEKVSAADGTEAGSLYGTDGTDGVVRGSASIVFELVAAAGGDIAHVQASVDVVDCGTF